MQIFCYQLTLATKDDFFFGLKQSLPCLKRVAFLLTSFLAYLLVSQDFWMKAVLFLDKILKSETV